MQQNSKDLFEFGAFRLDARERLLLRDGRPVTLTPKVYETLLALVESAGHLQKKEDLLKRIWPDTFVEEATLAKNIFTLRKILRDDQEIPQFIETVPKSGYRFIGRVRAIVEETGAGTIPGHAELAKKRPRGISALVWAVVVIGALLVVAGYRVWIRSRPETISAANRALLVVLPFENLSNDPGQSFFSDGLTEEMITQIAGLDPGHLGVIARTSAMQYRDRSKSALEIAHELGVDYLLEGSVRRDGEHIRVTAQLIRARDQSHLWAASYDRDLRNVLALQSEIARAVASQVGSRLAPEDVTHRAAERSVDPEAYDLYLKARHFWNRRTSESISKAIVLLQQAIARDPNYARAHAALADCYVIEHIYVAAPGLDALHLAETEASRALELDPLLGEAYATRGDARVFEWRFAAAEADFRKSFQLSPYYATAHQWYGEYLRMMGRQQEAIEESKRALELDPLSSIINDEAALPYYYLGNYDRAIAQLKRTLELDPYFAIAHGHLAMVYDAKGMRSEALLEIKEAKRIGDAPWIELILGVIEAHNGHMNEARRILKTLEGGTLDSSEAIGLTVPLHVALGEKEEALAKLELAIEKHEIEMVWVRVEPFLNPLRGDPRFQEMLRKIGFPR